MPFLLNTAVVICTASLFSATRHVTINHERYATVGIDHAACEREPGHSDDSQYFTSNELHLCIGWVTVYCRSQLFNLRSLRIILFSTCILISIICSSCCQYFCRNHFFGVQFGISSLFYYYFMYVFCKIICTVCFF